MLGLVKLVCGVAADDEEVVAVFTLYAIRNPPVNAILAKELLRPVNAPKPLAKRQFGSDLGCG